MRANLIPESEAEVQDAVASSQTPMFILGSGTKLGWGRLVDAPRLDLSKLDHVYAFEPEELILEAGAGAKRWDIEKLLDQRGQQFAFEPPDFSGLFGTQHAGTLGGMLTCNLAGPRRIKAGAARDHVLGVSAVSGRGELFKAGARVVKNVTGYDVPKLMAHSFGTLAAITRVIFKVLPRPETEETIVVEGLDDAAAVAAMSLAMQSACEVSGAAHVPGEGTCLRLEGISASVAYRRDVLMGLVGDKAHVLPDVQSQELWRRVRDVSAILDNVEALIWRVSVPPSDAPRFLQSLRQTMPFRYFLDWAGGLVWLETRPEAEPQFIRSALSAGHATLLRAPEAMRRRVSVFQPQPEELAALTRRVKQSFDPDQRLNPGRMYEGV